MADERGARRARGALTRGRRRRPLLSVVMPAHNEGGVIDDTLARIAALGRGARRADRGHRRQRRVDRRDVRRTPRRALGRSSPGTRRRARRRTSASHAAMRCGLRYARGEHVAIMAADGQDPPEALPGDARRDAARSSTSCGAAARPRATTAPPRAGGRRLLPDRSALLTGLDYPPSGLDFLRRPAPRGRRGAPALRAQHVAVPAHLQPRLRAGVRGVRPRRRGRRLVELDAAQARSSSPSTCSRAARRRRSAIASLVGMLAGLFGHRAGRRDAGAGRARGRPGLRAGRRSWWSARSSGGLMLVAIAFLGEYTWRILDEVRGAPPFIEGRSERWPPNRGRKHERGVGAGGHRPPARDGSAAARAPDAGRGEQLELDLARARRRHGGGHGRLRRHACARRARRGAHGVRGRRRQPLRDGGAGPGAYPGSRRRSGRRASGSRWSWARTPPRWRTPTS